jgi:hypothetical protein
MKWMRWSAAILLAFVAAAALYYWKYPNYSYRYRLTVEIESDGQVRSGSSVIQVTWHGGPEIGDVGRYSPTLKGQAALVDLKPRGVIVATLVNGTGYGAPREAFGPWGALWLFPRAFRLGTSVDELRGWSPPNGRRKLGDDNLPLFLWFPNQDDPTSGQVVTPSSISRILGPSVKFIGAYVEATKDPIEIDVGKKLRWIEPLSHKFPEPSPIYLSSGLAINRYMFIGDAS